MSLSIPKSMRANETANAVRDGFISYHRAQSYTSHASFCTLSDVDLPADSEDEGDSPARSHSESEDDGGDGKPPSRTRNDNDDDDGYEQLLSLPPLDSALNRLYSPAIPKPGSDLANNVISILDLNTHTTTVPVSETTPLLRAKPSISFADPTPRRLSGSYSGARLITRRSSTNSLLVTREQEVINNLDVGGQSTFGQSLFNSIATLLGVGILSEPFAFAASGWVVGTVLTISYGFLTCHTAKILARFIYGDSRLKTYADCSQRAFGPKSTIITSMFFFIELFTVSVVLVVLFSDSLHAVIPALSSNTYKLLALALLIPTAFFPLSIVSYTSLISVFATVFIGIVLVVNGLNKREAPGSLWEGMGTDMAPASAQGLGLSFGIFMAGFAGHAVIPSIARDMRHPREFERMINWAFVITTIVYGTVGACGYIMFGRDVSDEISRDLLSTPGYSVPLTRMGMWMLVISPITKFALSSRPLNIMLEHLLDIEPPLPASGPLHAQALVAERRRRRSSAALSDRPTFGNGSGNGYADSEGLAKRSRRAVYFVVERITVVLGIVFVAISVPQFGVVMSLLGAFSAFTLCVTGPLAVELAINGGTKQRGWRGTLDVVLLVASVLMGGWGTISCILNQLERL